MIAIYARTTNENITQDVRKLLLRIVGTGMGIVIYEPYYRFLKQKLDLGKDIQTFKNHKELIKKAKYLISLGGDGTLLQTIRLVRDSGIPVLGVNTGRLGFLANASREDIDQVLDALVTKKFKLDKRALLRLETKSGLFGDENFALNEFTIVKKDPTMMTIHAYIDGQFLNSYWADGLIVSTPTGSTAYSLSCGGPIVVPDAKNFIITPIAPHNLNVRPIVIADNETLTLKIEGRSNTYLVSLDSRSETVDPTVEFTIRKEDFYINLIRFEDHNFFNTIRGKLMWGMDKRN